MTKKKSTHNPPKAQGHELPPLLPLEYCHIERAARLLGCEVDDLIHWGAIGAIGLCVMLDGLEGRLAIHKKADDVSIPDSIEKYWNPSEEDREELTGFIDEKRRDGGRGDYIEHKKDARIFNKSRDIFGELQESSQFIEAVTDFAGMARMSRFEIDSFTVFKDAILWESSVRRPKCPGVYHFPVTAFGPWRISRRAVADLEKTGKLNRGSGWLRPVPSDPHSQGWAELFPSPNFHSSLKEGINKSTLWLTWIDLVRAQKLIKVGYEELFRPELRDEIREEEKREQEAEQRTRAPRTEVRQSDMIKALLLLHPNISAEQLEHPHTLHSVLTAMFSETKGKAIMPDIPPETFSRWLRK